MDRAGRNPIHYAAASDEASEVASLLAGGESPDVQDKQGFAPLHLAAQQFAVATAQALLDAGATVDLDNMFGNTALHVAVFNSHGRGDLIELLRARGADPLHANQSGQTPAGLARLIGNYDVARFFDDVEE